MTARLRILLDARGGGFGHARRGTRLAEVWRGAGHQVQLIVSRGSEGPLPADADRLQLHTPLDPRTLPDADLLLVDTFAEGFGGEWTPAQLARYPQRVLLARHRLAPPQQAYAHYPHIWRPYSADTDEWPTPPPGSLPIGLLSRALPVHAEPERAALAVFDPGRRLDARARGAIGAVATTQRRPLRWLRSLTERLGAAKLLVIGAGYNTVYELLRTRLDVRFVPLRRRHDDQFARARRLGVALESPTALAEWLRAACTPRPLAAHHFATDHALGALL